MTPQRQPQEPRNATGDDTLGQLRMIIEKVQEQRRILHFFQLKEAGSGCRLSGYEDIFAGNAGRRNT